MGPVDTYIAQFPTEVQAKLHQLRSLVFELCPDAEEVISYQMPTYKWNGILLHFAGYKNHIGVYPSPAGLLPFPEKLKNYKHSKGAVQFPLEKELPVDFIKEIITVRINHNLEKSKAKSSKAKK